jgi:hypothetical protein
MFLRALCFASVALLAGCSYSNAGPNAAPAAATVAVAPAAAAPARPAACGSNDDCSTNHTGGLCVPKPVTKELSDAEDFLERAMSLHDLIASLSDSSSSPQIKPILRQVREDISTYAQIASGRLPPGADAGGGGRCRAARRRRK